MGDSVESVTLGTTWSCLAGTLRTVGDLARSGVRCAYAVGLLEDNSYVMTVRVYSRAHVRRAISTLVGNILSEEAHEQDQRLHDLVGGRMRARARVVLRVLEDE